jgi:hypothetical protein
VSRGCGCKQQAVAGSMGTCDCDRIVGMAEAPHTRRRWFQFSLGTMLLVMTGVACWLGVTANVVHKRRQVSDWVLEHGGWLEPSQNQTTVSVGRRWMGDRAIDVVILDRHERLPKDITFEKINEVSPEAQLTVLSDHPGPNEWRPPNRAKEARDKAWSEKLRAKRTKREARKTG